MSNITPFELERLPRDMVIEVLNRMSIRDLLNTFETSKTLRNRYYPYLKTKINQAQLESEIEAVEYPYMKKITKEHKCIDEYIGYNQLLGCEYYRPLLLDTQISKLMGLGHLPKINGGTFI